MRSNFTYATAPGQKIAQKNFSIYLMLAKQKQIRQNKQDLPPDFNQHPEKQANNFLEEKPEE
jgi:hypothetical protein